MKTWIVELAVVWVVLIGVVAVTRGGLLEAVGSLAVLAAFAHAQVAERMREKEAAKAKPDVHCHRWLTRYFLVKELLWCSYFVAHRSWAALAGVGVFLAYPVWRAWWRRRHPLRHPRLNTVDQISLFLNGREFRLLRGFELNASLPWSAFVTVELHRVADGGDIDHMMRMGALLHVCFASPGVPHWYGRADLCDLKFWSDHSRRGVDFASFRLIGSGGLSV